jgi:hypothetical protein
VFHPSTEVLKGDGADDLVWFPREVLEDLAREDKVQVKACGVGLEIEGF